MEKRNVIPDTECLTCHYKMDSSTCVGGNNKPKKDDIAVCMKCGTASKFDDKLNMVALTMGELQELKEKWPGTYIKFRAVQSVIQANLQQN